MFIFYFSDPCITESFGGYETFIKNIPEDTAVGMYIHVTKLYAGSFPG